MNNDSVPMSSGLLSLEGNTAACAEESGGAEEQLEFSIMILGDAWPRTQASAREFALSPPLGTERHHELILSGTQLMLAVGSALVSIFLFVWALLNLSLTES